MIGTFRNENHFPQNVLLMISSIHSYHLLIRLLTHNSNLNLIEAH